MTVFKLSNWLIQGIRHWLSINVPQFADIMIPNSGKFLRWHLGRQAATLCFAAPIENFANRVHEICLGKAPAAVAMIRYDERVLPFFHMFLSLLFLLLHLMSRL